jgi:hypothetical protein
MEKIKMPKPLVGSMGMAQMGGSPGESHMKAWKGYSDAKMDAYLDAGSTHKKAAKKFGDTRKELIEEFGEYHSKLAGNASKELKKCYKF